MKRSIDYVMVWTRLLPLHKLIGHRSQLNNVFLFNLEILLVLYGTELIMKGRKGRMADCYRLSVWVNSVVKLIVKGIGDICFIGNYIPTHVRSASSGARFDIDPHDY